jgi:hypothetical protein
LAWQPARAKYSLSVASDELQRWYRAAGRARRVLCVGDSTTRAFAGAAGVEGRGWVELLAIALGEVGDLAVGEGFRGLWRDQEWTKKGTWIRPGPTDQSDVGPFGWAYRSSGEVSDELTWNKPQSTRVVAFDLHVVNVPDLGSWEYRVDGGPWRSAGAPQFSAHGRLGRLFVDEPVDRSVQIRAGDADAPYVAAIVGLSTYTLPARAPRIRVHNLGVGMQFLSHLCRASSGDPLALLDDLRPELVIVAFSNDVLFEAPSKFEASLRTLVDRMAPFGDLLLVSAYEQRPPRRVHDAVTTAGSPIVTSKNAHFVPSDVRERVTGASVPDEPPAVIRSVESSSRITLSASPVATLDGADMVIGRGRECAVQAEYRAVTQRVAESTGCAHIDLYEAWSSSGATGWDAAHGAGLMLDRYHASQAGHHDIANRLLGILKPDAATGAGSATT